MNIATSATTGATHASTGFIFTFPAIFLLASSPDYEVSTGALINLGDGDALIWHLLVLLQACLLVS